MKTGNQIQEELNQLGVNSVPAGSAIPYKVPAGYFEHFPEKMLALVLRPDDAETEIEELSPLLAGLRKENPFIISSTYFEALEGNIKAMTHPDEPSKELKSISPLLAGMGKTNPYQVPAGYFETSIPQQKNEGRVVSMAPRRSWMRIAAAAVVAGIVAIGALVVINGENKTDTMKEADLAASLRSLSTEELNEFLELAETETAVALNRSEVSEINELVKDVPDGEIKELLEDAETLEEEDLDILLN